VGVGRGLGITYLGVLDVLRLLKWKGGEERRRKKEKRKRGKRGPYIPYQPHCPSHRFPSGSQAALAQIPGAAE
jgi:hypothetical protein